MQAVVPSKPGATLGSNCTLGTARGGDCTLGNGCVSVRATACRIRRLLHIDCFVRVGSCSSWLILGAPLLASVSLTALVQSAIADITLLACAMLGFLALL